MFYRITGKTVPKITRVWLLQLEAGASHWSAVSCSHHCIPQHDRFSIIKRLTITQSPWLCTRYTWQFSTPDQLVPHSWSRAPLLFCNYMLSVAVDSHPAVIMTRSSATAEIARVCGHRSLRDHSRSQFPSYRTVLVNFSLLTDIYLSLTHSIVLGNRCEYKHKSYIAKKAITLKYSWILKTTKFGEITQITVITPLKVIQGRRFWNQSKARPVRKFILVNNTNFIHSRTFSLL